MSVPVEVVRGQGAYLHTREGQRIFDAISSWWVTLHGHAQPEIAEAIAHQAGILDQAIFTTFTHEPAALLAEELATLLPDGLTRVFFSDDGSTAVEVAVKMALQYHANIDKPRRVIAAFDNAYHGDTFGAMSVSGRGVFTAPFETYLFEVHHLPDPTEGDTIAALDALLERNPDDVAAILIEPLLMGAGGMRMYNDSIVRALRDRTRSNGVLLIADEVLTGFGRTGPLFACERAGIVPDIICLSKGITGGTLPLGATVATEEIFESFLSQDRRRMLLHGHSFTANPISCAAARASLRLLNNESAARREQINRTHATQLDQLAGHPLVERCRVLGTVAAFNLPDMTTSGYLSPIGRRLADFALERDVLLRPLGDVVYILPPYCSTADELTHVYSVIGQFLMTC
jgi:adenosylmethionine-8-amino-7-oxononanoate aminotransferase